MTRAAADPFDIQYRDFQGGVRTRERVWLTFELWEFSLNWTGKINFYGINFSALLWGENSTFWFPIFNSIFCSSVDFFTKQRKFNFPPENLKLQKSLVNFQFSGLHATSKRVKLQKLNDRYVEPVTERSFQLVIQLKWWLLACSCRIMTVFSSRIARCVAASGLGG